MFVRHDITLMSNPQCKKSVADINSADFLYYDKDGFELNLAEQKYYSMMEYPVDHVILNHHCWQEPWFSLESTETKLILDHCMFLCRAKYSDSAAEQLEKLKVSVPQADLLLRTKQKWGYDFALDAVSTQGTVFEVLHIEYDNYDYNTFKTHLIMFEHVIKHTDWEDAAIRVWEQRNQWVGLQGMQQNHWKARFLLGWEMAEYTEKAIS